MTAASHLVDRIEALLKDGDGPMTVPQICSALPITVDDSIVANVLRTGKQLGQFQVHLLNGKAAYCLNTRRARTEATEPNSEPVSTTEPDRPGAPATTEAKRAPGASATKPNFTELIRSALRDGSQPMTREDVCAALAFTGKDRVRASALLAQRTTAGEFAMQVVGEERAYSLNPDYRKRDRQRSDRRKHRAAPKAPRDASPPPPISSVTAQVATPAQSPPQEKPAANSLAVKAPFGFADRMIAIVEDLDGAVTDAVEMDLDKRVLAQLITAMRLVNAALVATLRS